MHDLNFFRKNLEEVRRRLATRGYVLDVDAFQDLDKRRRQCVTESEQVKASRNQATLEIGKLRKEGIDTSEKQLAVRAADERSAALEKQVDELDTEFQDLLASVPNLPNESVPVGNREHDNVEVRRWGTPANSLLLPNHIGTWVRNSASWIWSGRPK